MRTQRKSLLIQKCTFHHDSWVITVYWYKCTGHACNDPYPHKLHNNQTAPSVALVTSYSNHPTILRSLDILSSIANRCSKVYEGATGFGSILPYMLSSTSCLLTIEEADFPAFSSRSISSSFKTASFPAIKQFSGWDSECWADHQGFRRLDFIKIWYRYMRFSSYGSRYCMSAWYNRLSGLICACCCWWWW